jgi:antitoxin (DNA-binding transcriptional repressor) of toxin-antitoxin stability system
VQNGEEVLIHRHGKPVARLAAAAANHAISVWGYARRVRVAGRLGPAVLCGRSG